MTSPELIRRCFDTGRVLYSSHARQEMRNEEFGPIADDEVYETICNGDVIESYPQTTPYPCVLIFGMTNANRPLHAVCAYDKTDAQTVVVTVYQPDPARWDNYRRRKV